MKYKIFTKAKIPKIKLDDIIKMIEAKIIQAKNADHPEPIYTQEILFWSDLLMLARYALKTFEEIK